MQIVPLTFKPITGQWPCSKAKVGTFEASPFDCTDIVVSLLLYVPKLSPLNKLAG